MKTKMKIIARHKWVNGCLITESFEETTSDYRRFTATINGWRGFKIYEGYLPEDMEMLTNAIIKRVKSIKTRIESGEDSVFKEDTKLFSIV